MYYQQVESGLGNRYFSLNITKYYFNNFLIYNDLQILDITYYYNFYSLLNFIHENYCRKLYFCKELTSTFNSMKIKDDRHRSKHGSKAKFNTKFREMQRVIKTHSTATFSDWCYCRSIQTDSNLDWNHHMRMINGNRSGKLVKDSLEVLYQNLPGSLGEDQVGTHLDTITERFKPDILFVGETETEKVKSSCPDGYTWVGGNLKGGKKGIIRVSALISDKLPFKAFNINTKIPAVGLKVGQWKFIGVYREWALEGDQSTKARLDQIDRLSDFTNYWLSIKGRAAVLGDFNFDPVPDTDYQKSLENIRTLVNDDVLPTGWRQLIRGKTRFEVDKAPSQLDHVYVNKADSTIRTWNENITGNDHNMIGLKVKAKGQIFRAETFEYRNIDNITVEQFREVWEDGQPSDIYREKDPSEALKIWEYKVHRALDILAPPQQLTTKPNYNPWFTRELRELCDERDTRRKEAELWGTREALIRYKTFRNMVNNKLKKARFDWRKEHLSISDSKKMWARIKKAAGMTKLTTEEMTIMTNDGELTDPKDLSDFMNKFFKSKVENLQKSLTIDKEACLDYAEEYMSKWGSKRPKFRFNTVGTGKVSRIIRGLKNTGAQGRDSISTKVLKKFRWVLASPLRHIVNRSILSGIYPSGWKLGLVSPLPKSGDLTNPKNWRPVCILPAPSKVLEGVLQEQLQEYMETNQIFSNSQHAYRPRRSCESALLDLDTLIQKGRNEGKVVGLIMTDMSAAFNLIQKQILVAQLKIYGFTSKARTLVHSYLSQRKTRCKIKHSLSDPVTLTSGVGEGSVLGPCYFICGMCSVNIVAKRTERELAKREIWVEATTLEFADDTSGIVIADSEEDLQEAINVMSEMFKHYFNSMGMCLNQSKGELIIFRSKKAEKVLTLPGGQEESKTVKLLGLWIDNDYRFETHTAKVCNKLRFKIANITRVRPYLSMERVKMITESLVISTVNYMGVLYLRLPSNQKKVQKLVNQAARVILQADKRAHIEDMNRELYWLNMTNSYTYLLIASLRRLRERLMIAPVTHGEIFVNRDLALYKLRAQHLRVQWRKLTAHGRNSFCVQGVNAYNKYELNGAWFGDEDSFKVVVKFKIFKGNPNGNVT